MQEQLAGRPDGVWGKEEGYRGKAGQDCESKHKNFKTCRQPVRPGQGLRALFYECLYKDIPAHSNGKHSNITKMKCMSNKKMIFHHVITFSTSSDTSG